jgi:hypothetical protein
MSATHEIAADGHTYPSRLKKYNKTVWSSQAVSTPSLAKLQL